MNANLIKQIHLQNLTNISPTLERDLEIAAALLRQMARMGKK